MPFHQKFGLASDACLPCCAKVAICWWWMLILKGLCNCVWFDPSSAHRVKPCTPCTGSSCPVLGFEPRLAVFFLSFADRLSVFERWAEFDLHWRDFYPYNSFGTARLFFAIACMFLFITDRFSKVLTVSDPAVFRPCGPDLEDRERLSNAYSVCPYLAPLLISTNSFDTYLSLMTSNTITYFNLSLLTT